MTLKRFVRETRVVIRASRCVAVLQTRPAAIPAAEHAESAGKDSHASSNICKATLHAEIFSFCLVIFGANKPGLTHIFGVQRKMGCGDQNKNLETMQEKLRASRIMERMKVSSSSCCPSFFHSFVPLFPDSLISSLFRELW